ncbi:hypothetical protein FA95DRAFT_1599867 [Auriscalpium vulgare]|uniref:Uncharacterized protein n=2 Tax=Auriscalpium vulgare TaxID=40419 RepID=A0ACB8R607_9AGAM|nr:hypothetical protein FA95DRAFT_1600131 [Auriscalpium vulgare]KAI0039347.1 hypothetical protein FA95DRAFT_1599867 [Auriscalpium vulgare]
MPRADADSTILVPNVPVSRLPPEVLTHVFSLLSSVDRPRIKMSLNQNQADLGWLKVTHVCQRWRNIALNEPLLWASDIVLPSLLGDRWAATFVTRAQDVPLTVTLCDAHASNSRDGTPFIGANLARTRAIMDLRTYSHYLHALCTPAPILHTLGLRIYAINELNERPYLPEGLFGGAAGLPELRHLSVAASTVCPWTSLLLQQLVSVNIAAHHQKLPGAVLASMFAALGKMRGLERLKLDLTPEDVNGVPATPLPALQHLSLCNDFVKDALLILDHLALPASTRIHSTIGMDYLRGLRTVFPEMNARIDPRAAAISRVDVNLAAGNQRSGGPRRVEVGAWRGGDTDGAPALAVRLIGWKNVPAVLKSIASTHLEALAVGGDARAPDAPDAAWLDALGSATRLHRVTVKGGAVPQFCATPHSLDVLPALSVLVVNIRSHPLAKNILQDKLPRCLAERARAGNVLKELEVIGYSEDEASVCALQEAVPGLVIRWSWEAET